MQYRRAVLIREVLENLLVSLILMLCWNAVNYRALIHTGYTLWCCHCCLLLLLADTNPTNVLCTSFAVQMEWVRWMMAEKNIRIARFIVWLLVALPNAAAHIHMHTHTQWDPFFLLLKWFHFICNHTDFHSMFMHMKTLKCHLNYILFHAYLLARSIKWPNEPTDYLPLYLLQLIVNS